MKKIVCLGDSLTFGCGINQRLAWPYLMGKASGIAVKNKGINGDTSSGMLVRFQRDVLDERPDLVVIMGGSNDLIASQTTKLARMNIMAMVAQAQNAGIVPVIGIPTNICIDMVPKEWFSMIPAEVFVREITEYQKWLRTFGTSFGLEVLDFADYLERSEEEISSFYIEGVHLNEKGHAKESELAISFLKGRN